MSIQIFQTPVDAVHVCDSHFTSTTWRVLLLVCTVISGACAAHAPALQPRSIPAGHGGVMGQVTVTNRGKAVTKNCYLHFSGQDPEQVTSVHALKNDGWVFVTLPTGAAYVRRVKCVLGGMFKYNGGTDILIPFNNPGEGKIAYFGDSRVKLDVTGGLQIAGGLIGGGVGAVIANSASSDGGKHKRKNRFAVAQAQLRRRYGQDAQLLSPVDVSGLPVSRPRVLARSKPMVVSTGDLHGMRVSWVGTPEASPPRITIRFRRHGPAAAFAKCKALQLLVGGLELRLPLKYEVKRSSTGMEELLEAETDLDTVRELSTGKDVEYSLCDTRRLLSVSATDAAKTFLTRYSSLLPVLHTDPRVPPR